LELRFPGALGTTYFRDSSARMILPTFTNCSALASELPPNLTTFTMILYSFEKTYEAIILPVRQIRQEKAVVFPVVKPVAFYYNGEYKRLT
jgi:hypothetical protein